MGVVYTDKATDPKVFFSLMIMGSVLAGSGFMTDNVAVIIGAMMVSPILRPVEDFIDHGDTKELLFFIISALVIAPLIGIIFGLIEPRRETSEMVSRVVWTADKSSFFHSTIIAIVSGFVLAMAKQWDDFSVVAGIGVAGALLPPLVNAGIYLGSSLSTKKGNESLEKIYKAGYSFGLAGINIILISLTFGLGVKFIFK